MKVTKIGKGAEPWARSCICGKCNSTLDVSEEDLVRCSNWSSIDFLIFKCAACGAPNGISSKMGVPPIVWDRVRQSKPGSFPAQSIVMCAVKEEEGEE